jgi:AcrR family transcriptional regulator
MQRPDEKKRQMIVATAARMFAARPYHKVRLDDIAAEARIGKGTVYIYFDNKEDLYFSLIYDGLERLVERLRSQVLDSNGSHEAIPASVALRRTIDELVGFAFAHPQLFELIRTAGDMKGLATPNFSRKRQELQDLVAAIIKRGVKSGELDDPNPDVTAACLGGMVRSIMLFGPRGLSEKDVARQLYRLLERGIVKRAAKEEA